MDNAAKHEYKSCYIAFLDILGFKSMIGITSCQEILDIFKDMKNPLKAGYVGVDGKSVEITAAKCIKTKVMSDSICFYIDSSLPDALLCLIVCCCIFQAKLLRRSPPILSRGAIVLGNIYADGDITFGPGITQAYLLEEKNAIYPRIIMTKETLLKGKENASSERLAEALFENIICDTDRFYCADAIGCLLKLEPANDEDTPKKRYQELQKHVASVLSSTTDGSIRTKYLYLEEKLPFYEQINSME